jgi:hypothetical protein
VKCLGLNFAHVSENLLLEGVKTELNSRSRHIVVYLSLLEQCSVWSHHPNFILSYELADSVIVGTAARGIRQVPFAMIMLD